MKTIWKFPVGWVGPITLTMPAHARVLCVQTQGGNPHLWAEVESDNVLVARKFHVIGTGHGIPAGQLRYVDTYQVMDGALVWHVFEELP